MNYELLLSIKNIQKRLLNKQKQNQRKHSIDFKISKKMETFPRSPPINLPQEGKWLLAVTSFEATNSVLNVTDENNSF